jgi:hypothetical protein
MAPLPLSNRVSWRYCGAAFNMLPPSAGARFFQGGLATVLRECSWVLHRDCVMAFLLRESEFPALIAGDYLDSYGIVVFLHEQVVVPLVRAAA